MPFSQQLIINIPPFALGLILVAISVVFSVTGLILTRKFVSHQRLKVHNDVAGPIFATLGVIYAVLLAFVVVITWQNFDRSNLNAEKEASFLADLYTDSQALFEPQKKEVRALLEDYRLSMLNEEWKIVSKGGTSPRTEEKLSKIWAFYTGFTPRSVPEDIFFRESVRKLNEMCELRRMRLVDAKSGIHYMLWFVLISGGIITVVFSFFFGTENFGAQLIMTTLLAVLIALVLLTIMELDFPFSGEVSIAPQGFTRALNY